MNNPVGWFEIYVQEMPRAKAFYESVFGLKLDKLQGTEYEMWSFPVHREGPGAPGALIRIPGYASGANSILVYFSCDDCATQAERAVAAGGEIETPKKSIGPYGYIALVFDTERNLIGLHSLQ